MTDNPPLPAGYVDELTAVARDAYRDTLRRSVAGPFIDEVNSHAWTDGPSTADVEEARQALRAHPRDEHGRLTAGPPPPPVVNRFAATGRVYLDAMDLDDPGPDMYDTIRAALFTARRQMLDQIDARVRELVAAGIPMERLRLVDEEIDSDWAANRDTFSVMWSTRIELVDPEETSPPPHVEAP